MKPKICEKTIAYGNQRYKTDGAKWWVLMFGTYSPACNGIPSWRYMPISEDRIPKEVRKEKQL